MSFNNHSAIFMFVRSSPVTLNLHNVICQLYLIAGGKILVYTYSGILFNLYKEGNPDIYDNLGELRGHHAKWNKLATGGKILHGSTHIKYI